MLKEYAVGDKKMKRKMAKSYGKDEIRGMMHYTQSQNWLHENTKKCPGCKVLIQVIKLEPIFYINL